MTNAQHTPTLLEMNQRDVSRDYGLEPSVVAQLNSHALKALLLCAGKSDSLIAAAPELLNQLTNLVEICEAHCAHIVRKADINKARAAIAKAEGK